MAVVDFVLIGAPSAGAGALSVALRDHPQIALPQSTRASVLIEHHRYVFGPEWFEPGFFANERLGALRGMISPGHMSGLLGVTGASWPVENIAEGMVRTLPGAKLIALLSDPIERAIAHHRLARQCGLERRPLARALRDQLSPAALEAAREQPRLPTGYIAWGEYGRVLEIYLAHYPRLQLLVLYRMELAGDAAGTLARVASFLGIEDHWPAVPGEDGDDNDPAQLPDDLRDHMRAHFAADAKLLEGRCATHVPWTADAPPPTGATALPPAYSDPAPSVPAGPAGVWRVAEEIADARADGRGYALIRIDEGELGLLNGGFSPFDGARIDLTRIGVRDEPDRAAAAVRDAIRAADAVSVIDSGRPQLDLQPRLPCSADVSDELLGIDPLTGLFGARSRPLPVLRDRPLALVGLSALVGASMWRRRERLQEVGLDVRLVVGLDDTSEVADALRELAVHREAYDIVLVAGDVPTKPLCVRLARELDLVALDIGHALDRTLHPRHATVIEQLNTRKDVTEYLRRSALPAPDPPNELEGQLVRAKGEAAVYYVERGAARALQHRELLELFDHKPVEIERDVLDEFPQGMPLFAVHERFGGTYLPINGSRRPIQLGMLFTVVDDLALEALKPDNRTVHWYPGAGPGLKAQRSN